MLKPITVCIVCDCRLTRDVLARQLAVQEETELVGAVGGLDELTGKNAARQASVVLLHSSGTPAQSRTQAVASYYPRLRPASGPVADVLDAGAARKL